MVRRTMTVQHTLCEMKTLLSRHTPLFRVMNPHPTSASNSSEMPSLISVRVFVFSSKSRILSLHVIVVIRYIFDRDQKLSPGALTMLKAGFKSLVIYFMFLTCFCHGYRVQWYQIPPLLPSVYGLDYMNFFCLNPRNFQLAYRGMRLNSRKDKKRSICWRCKRDDPLDNTGLILSRQRYGSEFSRLTLKFLCVCRLFRISLSL